MVKKLKAMADKKNAAGPACSTARSPLGQGSAQQIWLAGMGASPRRRPKAGRCSRRWSRKAEPAEEDPGRGRGEDRRGHRQDDEHGRRRHRQGRPALGQARVDLRGAHRQGAGEARRAARQGRAGADGAHRRAERPGRRPQQAAKPTAGKKRAPAKTAAKRAPRKTAAERGPRDAASRKLKRPPRRPRSHGAPDQTAACRGSASRGGAGSAPGSAPRRWRARQLVGGPAAGLAPDVVAQPVEHRREVAARRCAHRGRASRGAWPRTTAPRTSRPASSTGSSRTGRRSSARPACSRR